MKSFTLVGLTMALLAFSGCTSSSPSSTAELQFTPIQFEEGGVVLEDHYTLMEGSATVMSGGLDGLEISFTTPEKTDQIKFKMQLPSVEGFRVWESYDADAGGSVIHSELADLPLTLTGEDFLGNVDAFDHPAPATIDVEVWNRTGDDSFDVDYLHFGDFELTITEFRIEGDRLWMETTLTATMDPIYFQYTGALYDLSATITFNGVTLGRMEVE